jgi:serine/threonine-protein kinase
VSVPSRYQIEKEVGRGGMGVVYQATDQTLGRTVALKVLSQALSADENARELFFREARAVAQLIHPNIVTLFDAGAEGGQLFLVFEFLHGPTLRSLMKNPMPPRQFAHLGAGVADALAYAHSRGIVHRDVKPENVVIAAGDVPKLTDFGVAHVASEKHGTTKAVMGTPNYMAPEQIRGGKIGSWTDVYALGAVLYECATAQVVFPAGEPMFHHVYTPPADPRVLAPTLSVEASELILRCLAKDPEARPGSAGEVATRLREIVR